MEMLARDYPRSGVSPPKVPQMARGQLNGGFSLCSQWCPNSTRHSTVQVPPIPPLRISPFRAPPTEFPSMVPWINTREIPPFVLLPSSSMDKVLTYLIKCLPVLKVTFGLKYSNNIGMLQFQQGIFFFGMRPTFDIFQQNSFYSHFKRIVTSTFKYNSMFSFSYYFVDIRKDSHHLQLLSTTFSLPLGQAY